MVLFIIISLLFIFYAGVIFFYNKSWRQMPEFSSGQRPKPVTFSIIIPARNEEANIGKLLQSIQQQNYLRHLFEVIVVDDHSGDGTVAVVKNFIENSVLTQNNEGGNETRVSVRLLELKTEVANSYKKMAITNGIAAARYEWIVCTDADCIVPEKWLENFAALITEKDPVFIAAPVAFISASSHRNRGANSLLYVFQALDFLTLQGITAASVFKGVHSMCNGANLAYKRDVFYEVNGFKGIDNIASGDDMLLMHKIWKKYPLRVKYLKSAASIVETLAAPSWNQFFNQRIRWASKATSYDDKRIFRVLLLVYLFNFSFLVLLIASFFHYKYFVALLVAWIAKTIAEFPLMANVSRFFGRQSLLKYFFFVQPLHIAYTIIAGFLGSVGSYEWKGRRVK